MRIPTQIALLLALLCLCGAARAQDCRLALVLALDVSSSMNGAEDRLQRDGLAHAMTSPEVVRAFLAGDPVALYVFQWSGPASQSKITPGWLMVSTEADLARVAALVRDSQRVNGQEATATGAALVHAGEALASGPDCRRRTVDVSSDGIGNQGLDARTVTHESPLYDGVTVNALLIGQTVDHVAGGATADSQLAGWFQHAVLWGPSSFYVVAVDFSDYRRAMTRKLLRELELPAVGGLPLAGDAG